MDLPGYGYAKAGGDTISQISDLISWYLFESGYNPTMVVLIDSVVGPTKDDLGILHELEKAGREIIVVANKVDKIKPSKYYKHMKDLQAKLPSHRLFPYSSTKKIGIQELMDHLLGE